METIAVYPVRAAPDAPLQRVRSSLEAEGFAVSDADEHDLAARRGLDRLFVGLGNHEEGLAARWKAKSLVPGRAREVHRLARSILTEVLGQPTRTLDPRREEPQ